jgi:hypothetical protein
VSNPAFWIYLSSWNNPSGSWPTDGLMCADTEAHPFRYERSQSKFSQLIFRTICVLNLIPLSLTYIAFQILSPRVPQKTTPKNQHLRPDARLPTKSHPHLCYSSCRSWRSSRCCDRLPISFTATTPRPARFPSLTLSINISPDVLHTHPFSEHWL